MFKSCVGSDSNWRPSAYETDELTTAPPRNIFYLFRCHRRNRTSNLNHQGYTCRLPCMQLTYGGNVKLKFLQDWMLISEWSLSFLRLIFPITIVSVLLPHSKFQLLFLSIWTMNCTSSPRQALYWISYVQTAMPRNRTYLLHVNPLPDLSIACTANGTRTRNLRHERATS